MNRTIEQTLLSLLPTLNSAPPPSLLSLAGSLLAQSRHRASTLKAEEEIARTYACAHIACDRLKISLNLPPIDPRPPIPPRIYKRLYAHLDKVLPNTTSTTPAGTPRSAARTRAKGAPAINDHSPGTPTPSRTRGRDATVGAAAATNDTPSRVPSRPTPAKEQSLAQFRPNAAATARRARDADAASPQCQRWVRPVARFATKELGVARLAASVIAGMDAILATKEYEVSHNAAKGRDASGGTWVAANNMTALVAAVVFYVLRAADGAPHEDNASSKGANAYPTQRTGADLTVEQYRALEKRLLDIMARAREEVTMPVPPTGGAAENIDSWKGWHALRPRALKKALVVVNECGWLNSDWYRGVRDIVRPVGDAHVDGGEDDIEGPDHRQTADDGQKRRGGTMSQPRYDYLSEGRRREFRDWKARMLKKIEELERDDPTEAEMMDIDG